MGSVRRPRRRLQVRPPRRLRHPLRPRRRRPVLRPRDTGCRSVPPDRPKRPRPHPHRLLQRCRLRPHLQRRPPLLLNRRLGPGFPRFQPATARSRRSLLAIGPGLAHPVQPSVPLTNAIIRTQSSSRIFPQHLGHVPEIKSSRSSGDNSGSAYCTSVPCRQASYPSRDTVSVRLAPHSGHRGVRISIVVSDFINFCAPAAGISGGDIILG